MQLRPACRGRIRNADAGIARARRRPPVDREQPHARRRALAQVGDGGYALGARARQIRDDLFAKQHVDERDLLAIQLDDRAVFLQRWWTQLRLEAARARTPALGELAAAARTWQGRASADSVSYRIVRAWRLAVHARLLDGLTAPAQAALGDEFVMPDLPQFEGVAWPLVMQRPANLLPRRFARLERVVRGRRIGSARRARQATAARSSAPGANATPRASAIRCRWHCPRSRNACCACRPTRWPATATCRASSRRISARPSAWSCRRATKPTGFIHMPGGQSGNPLSPYWGAGHEDWVHGRPTPFLPGKPEHTLRLTPARLGVYARRRQTIARSAPGTDPAAARDPRRRRARRPCGCSR